jgi:hypothetical protein
LEQVGADDMAIITEHSYPGGCLWI